MCGGKWYRLLFIVGILLFVFPILSRSSFAYVYRISTFQNLRTGKTISVFSDIHNLGSLRQNSAQAKFFFEQIVRPAEKENIPVDLLNEDKFAYFQTQKSHQEEDSPTCPLNYEEKEQGVISFVCPYTSREGKDYELELSINNKEDQTEFSWIGSRLTYQMIKNKTDFSENWENSDQVSSLPVFRENSVQLESVDPRFVHFLWQISPEITSVEDLMELPQLEDHIHSNQYFQLISENSILKREIEKIDRRLDLDRERLQTVTAATTAADEISRLISEDGDLFASAVDKMALLESIRSQSENHHTVVMLGALHALALEKSLNALGFKKVYQTETMPEYDRVFRDMLRVFESRYENGLGIEAYSELAQKMSSMSLVVTPELENQTENGIRKIRKSIF